MANLEQIVSQKAENDTRWKAQQQSERENTVALQDAGIMQITSSPEAYARYLDMQGDNPAYINPDFPDHEAFAAIAAEVAQSRFHAKGATPGYNRAECELDAQSVSYILCRRFGIERPMPETERLPELYDGWETEDRRSGRCDRHIHIDPERPVHHRQQRRNPHYQSCAGGLCTD